MVTIIVVLLHVTRAHAAITLIVSRFLTFMTTDAEMKAILENKEKSSMSALCFRFRFFFIKQRVWMCDVYLKKRVRIVVCVSKTTKFK